MFLLWCLNFYFWYCEWLSVFKGVCALLKKQSKWLIVGPCPNNFLKLSIMDDSKFKQVNQTLFKMFLLTRNNRRMKRFLNAMTMDLKVNWVSFVEAHYSRFQNYKYCATKAFIINYFPISLLFENHILAGSKVCLYTKLCFTCEHFSNPMRFDLPSVNTQMTPATFKLWYD